MCPLLKPVDWDVFEDYEPVGARGKPAKDLDPPGRQIREARDELGLTSEGFAQLIGYEGSHIRNIERGANGYRGVLKACERAAVICADVHTAKVLADLAAFLRSFKPANNKAIHTRRGTERKQDQERMAERLIGEWWALWQTVRHGEEVMLVETVIVTGSGNGRKLEMTNREDSYWVRPGQSEHKGEPGGPDEFLSWSANCRVTKNDRWVLGDYTSLSSANKVDGVFRLGVGGFPEVIVGDWLGESWGTERIHGLLVFARDKTLGEARFAGEREKATNLPCFLA